MVHRGMLPCPRRHLDNRECCRRAHGAPQGCRTVGGGGIQRQPSGAGGRPDGRRYCGGDGKGEFGRYVGSLPPPPALMATGREDVEHDPVRDVGAVLDGLKSGDGFPSLCNVSVRDPRHKSDHYMILGYVHSASLREHVRYLGGSKRPPLCPSTEPTREDRIFAALRKAVPKTRAQEAWKNSWKLATTWRLMDKRVSARRYIVKYQALIRRLGRAIKASLREDRKKRAGGREQSTADLYHP